MHPLRSLLLVGYDDDVRNGECLLAVIERDLQLALRRALPANVLCVVRKQSLEKKNKAKIV